MELSPELAATYETKDPFAVYELGCGDDRQFTEEFLTELVADGGEPTEAMLRYFGALSGVSRVLLVTLLAQGKQGIVEEHFNGSFVEAMKKIKADIEAKNNVHLDLHTADGNEGNPSHFDPASEKGVGCAYGANAATIGLICADNEDQARLTQVEGQSLYDVETETPHIRQANHAFNAVYFPNPEVPGLTREDFSDTGATVQVLKGKHAKSEDTVAVMNFTTDKVSNPGKAAEIGKPFYDNDVTQVAEMLIRTYPEFKLDPETLFAVMDQDIRATRAALSEGNAATLKQARLGDPKGAIAYLKDLQTSLEN